MGEGGKARWVPHHDYNMLGSKKFDFSFDFFGSERMAIAPDSHYPGAGDLGAYHTYEETVDILKDLNSSHAEIVELVDIGLSYNNRTIWSVRITNESSGLEGKFEILFTGDHHARELITTEIVLYIMGYVVFNYGVNATITEILNSRILWFVPMVNPDGVADHIEKGEPWWRKNARSPYGVDINRNYGYQWGQAGSSDDKRSDIYRGIAPFSEPETRAIRDFVLSHNFVIAVNYHSGAELVLYPWGYTRSLQPPPPDIGFFTEIGKTIESMTGYYCQQACYLYLASGTAIDWMYHNKSIIAFNIEVYSNKSVLWFPDFEAYIWDYFNPPEDLINATCQRNLEAALYVADVTGGIRASEEKEEGKVWYEETSVIAGIIGFIAVAVVIVTYFMLQRRAELTE
ncbi:MAG: M14 family metallopeptidase [Candidatus Hodarchaeota archaeon]